MTTENDDVIFASGFVLRATLAVLIAESPDRKARVLEQLSAMKDGVEPPQILALLDKSIGMVQSVG